MKSLVQRIANFFKKIIRTIILIIKIIVLIVVSIYYMIKLRIKKVIFKHHAKREMKKSGLKKEDSKLLIRAYDQNFPMDQLAQLMIKKN